MKISLERVMNSRFGLNLAIFVARSIPHWLGYPLVSLIAALITSRKNSPQVKAVQLNQCIASGNTLDGPALDHNVREVFRNTARSIYDLYHYIQTPGRAERMFVFEESVMCFAGRPEFAERGLVMAGIHMSGFDLALQMICMKWLKPLVLTIPNPTGGRQIEFEIRKKTGMNLVPGDIGGLRHSIRHLEQGGMVVTGIDRPSPEYQPRLRFFNQMASLPTHHVYLALKSRVPVMVVGARLAEDGKYHISGSPPIEMDPYPDRQEAIVQNAEKILAIAENFIRSAPQQWSVTKPVWNDVPTQALACIHSSGILTSSRGQSS